MNWRSHASAEMLRHRAELMRNVRQFFYARDVLEVDTPALSRRGVSDCHIENLVTHLSADDDGQPLELFLQTSPEYAMKRLLAQHGMSLFQLSHVFRDDEIGRHHNPEFAMLEWYRIGYSMSELIREVAELLSECVGAGETEVMSYQQAFIHYTGYDPLTLNGQQSLHAELTQRADTCEWMRTETNMDTVLQVAFSLLVEPRLPKSTPVAITHFPASQAALAKLCEDDSRVALRFEVYYQGIELANGYNELTDAITQQQRFIKDNQQRQQMGKPSRLPDERLVAALESGLPDCSGVALGFDRLLMIATNSEHIQAVQPFSIKNC